MSTAASIRARGLGQRSLWPRRERAVGLLFVALLLSACAEPGAQSDAPDSSAEVPERRPNLVWIVADDMSPDIGAWGDPQASTPTLDRLAAEGVSYLRTFSISGVCAPSRSALHTGMYPTTLGSHHMRSWAVPPSEVRTLGHLLRRAGYFTTNDSKIDYNLQAYLPPPEGTPRERGQPEGPDVRRTVFEPPLGTWDESGPGAHWRHRPDPEQPFFAVFDLFVTHESRIRMPDEQFEALVAAVPPDRRHDPQDVELPPYYPDTPDVRRDLARYHDLVSAADLQVARILAELEEDEVARDTVVLFFGDHGRGLPRAKRWVWDSGIRVPLIVRWPGRLEAGSRTEELVSFVDFAPTMLALAGVEVPDRMQGRVFLGEGRDPEPEYVYAARDRMDETWDRIRTVRGRRWAYLRNFAPELPWAQPIDYMDQMPTMQVWRRLAAAGELEGPAARFLGPRKPPEELYDTDADPHQIRNLAGDPAHRVRLESMRAALDRWIEETGDLGGLEEAELIARMRPPGLEVETASPAIELLEEGDAGRVRLRSSTEGAVLEYRLLTPELPEAAVLAPDPPRIPGQPYEHVPWQLYREPLEVAGPAWIVARAGRLGFLDSEIVARRVAPSDSTSSPEGGSR